MAYSPEFIKGMRSEIFKIMREEKVSFLVARKRVLNAQRIISSDWSMVCSLVAKKNEPKKPQPSPRPRVQEGEKRFEPSRRNRAENGFQPDD